MKRPLILALAAASVTLFCAGAAQASNVHWSIGINLPPVGTVISNGPVYVPAPAYGYDPAPVRYVPPVVYDAPQAVYPAPPVVYYDAPPVVYRAPPPFYYGQRTYYPRPVVVVQPRRDGRWLPRRDDRDDRRDHRWHHD